MLYKKTIEDMRADVDGHATALRDEMERATTRLTVALIVVGALAAFAVIYVVANTPTSKAPS